MGREKWGKVLYSLMSHFLVSTSLFKKKKKKQKSPQYVRLHNSRFFFFKKNICESIQTIATIKKKISLTLNSQIQTQCVSAQVM